MSAFEMLINKIKEQLKLDLPGQAAQYEMAHQGRIRVDFNQVMQRSPKLSAVLILLYPKADKICVSYIQRPMYDGVHGGQIAFPGGRVESTDEDYIATAIRETQEEIGVLVNRNQIIGALSWLYIPPSNFVVYPYVAYLEEEPVFVPDQTEVAEVLEVDIKAIATKEFIKHNYPVPVHNGVYETSIYHIDGKVIWGATAMMTDEFRWVLERC